MKANQSAPQSVAESHTLEREVRRELMSHPELRFSSLVVRRIAQGVCLEGILHVDDGDVDVETLVRQVSGVDAVLNHLVIQPDSPGS